MLLKPLGVLGMNGLPLSKKFNGPFAERGSNLFIDQVWKSDLFTLRSPYAMVQYLGGPNITQVDNRILLIDDADGTLLTLNYIARVEMAPHVLGIAPAYLTGNVEVDEAHEKYAFLNRTQVVGKSFLKTIDGIMYQEYDMFYLD